MFRVLVAVVVTVGAAWDVPLAVVWLFWTFMGLTLLPLFMAMMAPTEAPDPDRVKSYELPSDEAAL